MLTMLIQLIVYYVMKSHDAKLAERWLIRSGYFLAQGIHLFSFDRQMCSDCPEIFEWMRAWIRVRVHVRKKKKKIYKFRCGVRCRVARLIFERLAYTRLVLKKLSGAVDKTADVIHEIQGPSISDERGQLNIGLTKNTTTLVRHSRSCGALRIIRHIKLYVARLARLCSLHVFSLDVRTNTSLRFFLSEEVSLSLSFSLLRTYVLACCTLARQARRDTQE